MKKLFILLLAVAMLSGLVTGCQTHQKPPPHEPSESQGSSAPKYKEEIVIASEDILSNLDPNTNNGLVNKIAYYSYFSTLFDFDTEKKEFYGDLVKDYTVDETGCIWTMVLHDDVLFHNGEKLTSADVKYSYERAAESSFQGNKVDIIESIETPNDYTVIMKLKAPHQEFLEVISDPGISIFCKSAMETLGEKEGIKIGSGAYKLKEFVFGDYVLLERFDDYFGEIPKTKYIRIRKIAEPSARLIALQTGEIDVCLNPSTVDLSHIAEDPNLRLLQMRGTKLILFLVNCTRAPFDNLKVRQAIAHALKRDDIMNATVDGLGEVTSNIMCWSATCASDNATPYTYDIEKAKELLTEAGYPQGFDCHILLRGGMYEAGAQVLQAQLAKIGIRLKIDVLDPAVAAEALSKGDFDCAMDHWSWTSSNDIPLRSQFGTTSGSNKCRYYNEEIDALLDKALFEMNHDKRVELYKEVVQLLLAEAPNNALFIINLNIAVGKNVHGEPGITWKVHGRHDFTYIYATEDD